MCRGEKTEFLLWLIKARADKTKQNKWVVTKANHQWHGTVSYGRTWESWWDSAAKYPEEGGPSCDCCIPAAWGPQLDNSFCILMLNIVWCQNSEWCCRSLTNNYPKAPKDFAGIRKTQLKPWWSNRMRKCLCVRVCVCMWVWVGM